MRYFIWFSIWVVAGTGPLSAAEEFPYLKVGTKHYTNVVVTSVTANDVFFTHSQGMGNAPLKNLPPEAQQKLGYDPAKAAAAEKAKAAGKATPPSAKAPPPPENITPADIPVGKISADSFLGKAPPKLVVKKWLTPVGGTQGKFVLIDFWATWCGPCRQSIPHLNQLQARFKEQLVVIGLSDETEAEVRKMKSPAMNYAVGVDPDGTTAKALNVRGIPHAIILDPKGIVRFEGHPSYLTEKNLAGLMLKYGSPTAK